jgi:hypothetical protein
MRDTTVLHSHYLSALSLVEEYHRQKENSVLQISDLTVDLPVRMNHPNSQTYWVSEVIGEDVLIRTTEDEHSPEYDDYLVNYTVLSNIEPQ